MASQYLTLDEFKERTLLPDVYVDQVESVASGWTMKQVAQVSTLDIDGRLRKRYACPFQAPVPEAIKSWVTRIVSYRLMLRRGFDPADPQAEVIKQDADDALAQIKEAADGEVRLFDLPVTDTNGATGIVKGGPLAITINSPYEAVYRRERRAREQDGGW
jgi:phage gp36-like protein